VALLEALCAQSKSATESHTLPPAKLCDGSALGLRLISACIYLAIAASDSQNAKMMKDGEKVY